MTAERSPLPSAPTSEPARTAPGRPQRASDKPGRGPALVGAVQLRADIPAVDHCGVLLAFHAAAIAQNLDCVFSSVDPEGPHQLRVALRRLRVVLRVFEPVMRRSAVAPMRDEARRMGAIVSELRDADVMIDEIIAPAARDRQSMSGLKAWRQEVRGRVRARLTAAGAGAFARGVSAAAAACDWRKRRKAQSVASSVLVDDFLADNWARVAASLPTLDNCPAEQIHALRKNVKALRYAAEMGADLGREDRRKFAKGLKRVQDALGYINDVETLRRFAPALVAGGEEVAALCQRLAAERTERARAQRCFAQSALQELGEHHAIVQRSAAVVA